MNVCVRSHSPSCETHTTGPLVLFLKENKLITLAFAFFLQAGRRPLFGERIVFYLQPWNQLRGRELLQIKQFTGFLLPVCFNSVEMKVSFIWVWLCWFDLFHFSFRSEAFTGATAHLEQSIYEIGQFVTWKHLIASSYKLKITFYKGSERESRLAALQQRQHKSTCRQTDLNLQA